MLVREMGATADWSKTHSFAPALHIITQLAEVSGDWRPSFPIETKVTHSFFKTKTECLSALLEGVVLTEQSHPEASSTIQF